MRGLRLFPLLLVVACSGGAAPLRFLCDPIGGEGLPVTEDIVVQPGDTVEMVIPAS